MAGHTTETTPAQTTICEHYAATDRKSEYLALLVAKGWLQTDLARVLGVKRQAVWSRVQRARAEGLPDQPGEHPIPEPPPRPKRPTLVGRTRGGLLVENLDAARAQAVADAEATLDRCGDAVERLEVCSQLLAETRPTVTTLRHTRGAAALSLWAHDGHRGVWRAAGWATAEIFFYMRKNAVPGFSVCPKEKLSALARRNGIQRIPDAAAVLRDTVRALVPAAAVVEYLEAERTALCRDLVSSNALTRSEAADAMDVSLSRVAHIMAPLGIPRDATRSR